MGLAQARVLFKLRGRDSDAVVLYGAASAGIVDGYGDSGGPSIKRVLDEAGDHVVKASDDQGGLDLGHNIPWKWLDGHGRRHIAGSVFAWMCLV